MPTTTAKRHTVKEGEHLSRIATLYGFSDYKAIWDYGENAELRKTRKDPHVLYAGDVVVIPEPRNKTVPKAAGGAYKFKLPAVQLRLELKLVDVWGKAIGGAYCRISEDSRDEQGNVVAVLSEDVTTKQDGRTGVDVSRTSYEAELLVLENAPPPDPLPFPKVLHKFDLYIGGLNPVCEPSGMRARLNNLGYFAGLTDGPEDREQLRWAIEEFQFDQFGKPFEPNGDLDDPDTKQREKIRRTREKLVEVHGDKEPVLCQPPR